MDEKYEADNLERILKERLEDTPLSASLTDLLVTSYDIQRRKPLFFKSWRARGEELRRGEMPAEREFKLRDVARATSAAPTYFEPALIENAAGRSFPLVDGGVFA
ncbi:MAG: patatin, partial [Nitrospinaceae bacterium]|nr:patatin [Nitrospinaceae bacterium]NIU98475.1 patatin [Nitrospinaceae bacterium]NIX34776.1 patatin [Nitrospinaceae bacterium]NIY17530.1 patatin [Nitrospinaceae bacterium]